jgi:hypothetical protein
VGVYKIKNLQLVLDGDGGGDGHGRDGGTGSLTIIRQQTQSYSGLSRARW